MPLSVPGKIQEAVVTTGMSYEGRAGFFECRTNRTKTFYPVQCLVKLAHSSFNARKDLESSFHHCAGFVELVHASFGVRKDLQSNFHHCGGAVKLVQDSLNAKTAVFTTVEVL